jgi:hypothetical protein
MAQASRALTLKLLADVSDFTKGLDQGEKKTASMGDKLKKFGKMAAAGLAVAGAAAAAFAVKAIAAGEAAATSNARIDQINTSMGLFGASTDEVTASLINYANETARATGIDQNSIKATQAKLLTFKEIAQTADEVNGNFQRATKAAIDLGAAGFGSAETNAVALGKALNDPIKGITALTRSGVTFTESEKERIKVLVESNKVGEAQNMILAAIETQVGGTAEATANASDRMKVGLSQVTETIGLALLPIFEKITAFIIDHVFPAFSRMSEPIGKFSDQVSQNLAPVLTTLTEYFQNNLIPTFKAIWQFITEFLIPAIGKFLTPIINGLRSAFEKVTSKIAENEEKLKPLLALFKVIAAFVRDVFAPIIGKVLGAAFKVLGTAVGFVITLFANLVNIVNQVVKAIRAVANFGGAIGSTISGALGFGGNRAMGGSVSSGMAYVVGERGPELFVPSNSGTIVPNGAGGTTINLTVNGAIDAEGTARTIIDVLNRSQARGTLGSAAFA